MIIGIGSDILDIRRIESLFARKQDKFAEKILSNEEMILWKNLDNKRKINFLSKRWAGKEAFAKACGTGIRKPVLFSDITIYKYKKGKPLIKVNNDLNIWLIENNIDRIHITLSDDYPYCIAFVVLESN